MHTRVHHTVGFILCGLLWGGSFLAIRFSIDAFPPFAAASLRVAIATTLLWTFMRWRRDKLPRDAKLVWQLLGIGFFTLGLPWALLFWGEQFVSPALCSILNSTTPIFTVVVAALIVRNEHVSWNKWLGVVAGFIGVLMIFWPQLLNGEGSSLYGMLAVTGMAMCYSIGIVWLKSLTHRISAPVAFFLQGIGALMFLVPFSLLAEWSSIWSANWGATDSWLAIVYLGVFSTAIAQLIFYVVLRAWGSVKTSAVTYIIPIVAVILDWIVFGTFLSANAIIGAAIILAGVRLIHATALIPYLTPRYFQNRPAEPST